ncbi:unnamed protein product [Cuscuta campestris]|uniref:HTH three-helical bundle domain-containing protein n=1 Tax=Cuscuta campestris TaxID=132261 RepID=A0A484LQ77_9ASTE|nr:unnamed protein product [Cuscuta campestris]
MGEEQGFPDRDELDAAEALLLLCFTPPSPSLPSESKRESSFPSVDLKSGSVSISEWNSISNSKSCASISSDVTWDGGRTFLEAQSHPCQKRLEVVRKKRSQSLCISNGQKRRIEKEMSLVTMMPSASSSCLSNESAASNTISSAGSHHGSTRTTGRWEMAKPAAEVYKHEEKKKKKPLGSIRRRAVAILNILSYGSASEVRIRQLLGDSPDTSKALRMLLKWEEVKRSGAGGQRDPFIYTIG